MGFFTKNRPSFLVPVLITESLANDPELQFASLQAGRTYEVNARIAEYLIASRHAIVDRRRSPRTGQSRPGAFAPRR
jgi:hypothetical protein